MSDLTARQRNKLPKKDFGEPGKEKYPMPDKAHARAAKAGASEEFNKGNLSESEKGKIDAKADKVLSKRESIDTFMKRRNKEAKR